MTISTTSGAVQFWINGASVYSGSNLNNGSNGITTIRCGLVWTYALNAATVYADDVVVATSGPIGAENHAGLVSDQSDTTGLQVSNPALKETLNLADSTTQSGTITSVTVYCRAKTSSGTTDKFVFVLRTHSSDYESASKFLTTSFAQYNATYTTNPNTSTAWTWADIAALELGARASTLGTGNTVSFSEFWIVVTYTPSS